MDTNMKDPRWLGDTDNLSGWGMMFLTVGLGVVISGSALIFATGLITILTHL